MKISSISEDNNKKQETIYRIQLTDGKLIYGL